jgi:hypothetical protein
MVDSWVSKGALYRGRDEITAYEMASNTIAMTGDISILLPPAVERG